MAEDLAPTRVAPRFTVIAMEIPFPAHHGGRADVWRRLKALKRAGAPVQLICWAPEPPQADVVAAIEAQTEDFICLGYPSGILGRTRRAIDLLSYPLGVTSRVVRQPALGQLIEKVGSFGPDVIMADHVHSATLAEPIAKALKKPFIVRSHDIEHLHYRMLMRVAPDLRGRLHCYLAQHNMDAFEKRIMKQCLAFFDISQTDLAYWQSIGFTNGYHLPPLIDEPLRLADADLPTYKFDAAFLGNLISDNNVAGVLWFLANVMPLLTKARPDIQVAIAGLKPGPRVVKACEETVGVTLLADPPDAMAVYRSARVCFDPVSTGLGVSLKSLDMLCAGRPIVSFEKGTNGLPESVKSYFRLAKDAPSFAAAVLAALSEPYVPPSAETLRKELGYGAILRFLDCVERLLSDSTNQSSPLQRSEPERVIGVGG